MEVCEVSRELNNAKIGNGKNKGYKLHSLMDPDGVLILLMDS
jgi:hypothetical protein